LRPRVDSKRFPEGGEKPEYNSADAALWFVVAAWRYWKASSDMAGTKELLPALRAVIKCYRDGTRYDISMDKDGLISAGAPGTQLTWMDVKVDGTCRRPGMGSRSRSMHFGSMRCSCWRSWKRKLAGDNQAAASLRKLADQVTVSFVKTFWNADAGCLYDVVQGNFRDPAIRPNQIFAVSLPHSPLDKAQQQAVLNCVTKHLLTPYGLRTLARSHEKYCPRYIGNTHATRLRFTSRFGLAVAHRSVLRRLRACSRHRQDAAQRKLPACCRVCLPTLKKQVSARSRKFLTVICPIGRSVVPRRRGAWANCCACTTPTSSSGDRLEKLPPPIRPDCHQYTHDHHLCDGCDKHIMAAQYP